MVKRNDQWSEQYNIPNVQVTTVRPTITEYLQEIFSKMSTTANINLNELYFEYKVLTEITGEPTFDELHKMFQQLKANMAAVPCTLGGGANGYLARNAHKYRVVQHSCTRRTICATTYARTFGHQFSLHSVPNYDSQDAIRSSSMWASDVHFNADIINCVGTKCSTI